MDVHRPLVRRAVAAALTVAVAALPTGAGATPAQEPSHNDRTHNDRTVVDAADVLAQDNPSAFTEALAGINDTVSQQLTNLQTAEAAVLTAIAALAEADDAVQQTEFRIEELNIAGDQIVADAFVNPPTEAGLEVFASDSITDAAVKRTLLDIQTDNYADALEQLDVQLGELEANRAVQTERLAAAQGARSDAQAALRDLQSSVSQQAQFVLEVRQWLAGQSAAADDAEANDPRRAEQIRARQAEVAEQLRRFEEAAAFARAMEALAEAERQRELAGRIVCPVQGPVEFSDTWGAPRSGGRSHEGVDMLADTGVPTVAPVSGEVVHRTSSLGGLSWYIYADNGDTYYGTHLSAYENQGAGRVEAGTVIGYVGDSGNAAGISHLHFEWMPGGGNARNAYPKVAEAC